VDQELVMSPIFRRRSVLFWIIVMTLAALFGPGLLQRFKMSDRPPHRARATGQIKAMEEGLEMYRVEYGKYPRPVGGSTDPIVQSKMLYQALTGDGSDFIDGVIEPTSSNGNPATDGKLILEAAFAGSKKSGFVHEDYYLTDPWGRPYHYIRGDESDLTHNKARFDLWIEDPRADKETWLSNWTKGR
jgi:hypothetical protein